MPRGGKREGAGRKTTWASGRGIEDTTVIRVPKEFASKLLEIAHKLDAGENIDFVTNSVNDTVTQSNITDFSSQAADLLLPTDSSAICNEVILENVTESEEAQLELVAESKNEKNESVTNSISHVEDDQPSLFVHPKVEVLSRITSGQMAKRIGISSSTLAVHKNQKSHKDFVKFLKARDPDGIAWSPIKEGSKLFYVILEKETKS